MNKVFALVVLVGLFVVQTANADFVNVVTQDFGDTTLASGLTPWNSPSVSGGVADLNGSNQGYTVGIGAYTDATGPTASWVMETVLADAATVGNVDTLLAFNGEYSMRYRTSGVGPVPTWTLVAYGTNIAVTGPQNGDHVALVYTKSDASGGTLAYYLNGQLDNSITATEGYYGGSNSAGWGFEVAPSAYHDRGFDGSIKSLAFSTFTGEFSTSNFVLLPVPEPSSIAMVDAGVMGLLAYAWRKRR